MAADSSTIVMDRDVFTLTPLGHRQLVGGSTALSQQDLSILVLMDGVATVAQLIRRLPGSSDDEVISSLNRLRSAKLIALETPSDSLDFTVFLSDQVPPPPTERALAVAKAEAATGEESLKQSGYYVGIARNAAMRRQLAPGERISILLIEDDPHMFQLVTTHLSAHGMLATVASNRQEIVTAFRSRPLPDLVLLDVMLPDANGFDILAKMRHHPNLGAVPVIMMTGAATRADVLQGLATGANGYVTKPFEPEALVRAVRSVLGLTA